MRTSLRSHLPPMFPSDMGSIGPPAPCPNAYVYQPVADTAPEVLEEVLRTNALGLNRLPVSSVSDFFRGSRFFLGMTGCRLVRLVKPNCCNSLFFFEPLRVHSSRLRSTLLTCQAAIKVMARQPGGGNIFVMKGSCFPWASLNNLICFWLPQWFF